MSTICRLPSSAPASLRRTGSIAVKEAEANGVEAYPLYAWTKKTVDDPAKEAKYTKSFTLYVGGDEVYERSKADALEAELKPLVGGPIVAKMFRYDTDPAHSPYPPQGRNE